MVKPQITTWVLNPTFTMLSMDGRIINTVLSYNLQNILHLKKHQKVYLILEDMHFLLHV